MGFLYKRDECKQTSLFFCLLKFFNLFLCDVIDFFKPFIDSNSFICLVKHSFDEDILPFIEA